LRGISQRAAPRGVMDPARVCRVSASVSVASWPPMLLLRVPWPRHFANHASAKARWFLERVSPLLI
jgi:hypothetical protein